MGQTEGRKEELKKNRKMHALHAEWSRKDREERGIDASSRRLSVATISIDPSISEGVQATRGKAQDVTCYSVVS